MNSGFQKGFAYDDVNSYNIEGRDFGGLNSTVAGLRTVSVEQPNGLWMNDKERHLMDNILFNSCDTSTSHIRIIQAAIRSIQHEKTTSVN